MSMKLTARVKRNALYLIGLFALTEVLVLISLVCLHPELGTKTQGYVHTFVLMPMQTKESNQKVEPKFRSKFEGLDFDDLTSKIKDSVGQNLRLRFASDKKSKTNSPITMDYTKLVFPTTISTSKAEQVNPFPRKYVYVHYMYNDQLSKNTRAFLSLCAQAGTQGRMVVKPFVRQTRFGKDNSWLPLDAYYNTKDLDILLAASGYARLVEQTKYIKECPLNSSDHVSVHFIDGSTASMGFTAANFHLKEDSLKAIIADTNQKGWTECEFIDRAMKRTSGRQFCVNKDIIKDWKVLENDVTKNAKCLNIYQWRGIDGVSYRLKFSEREMKYSSVDLTYALTPGQPVMNEVKRFSEGVLDENYIAVYVRSEFMLRKNSLSYLHDCVDLVLEVLVALKSTTGLSNVYVATDMGDYGSSWLIGYRSRENLDENVFKDIHDYIIQKSQGVAYSPSSDRLDRGIIALVDMTLISQAQYLISAGTGTFQAWIAAKFLANHRNDERLWSKITVCT